MANTYTTGLKLSKPGLGDAGWGTTVNGGFTDLVDQAVVGSVDVAVTSGGTTTLATIADGVSSDARNMSLIITGSLTSVQTATVRVPATVSGVVKLYSVTNSAGGTVTVETSGGTSVAVPTGRSMLLRVTSAGVSEAVNYVASLTLGTALPATSGGTGQSSYAVGDLLYADTTTTLAKLADVATGNVLRSGGVGVAPAWGKVGLTTDVTGTLPVANGGTGAATLAANNVLLGNGTSAFQEVAPGTSGNVLTSNGTIWQSTAPAAPYVGPNATVYTSGSATFTIPTGITQLKVTIVGGGGGSAGSTSGNTGGGGGGGGTAIVWLSGLTPGNTITYAVGTGGTAGTATPGNGGAGGNSSISSGTQSISTVTANGGGGGQTSGACGTAGTATGGTLNVQAGDPMNTRGGGNSLYGTGVISFTAVGIAGNGYGGGGAAPFGVGSGTAGAAGAAGVIIFEW